MPSYELVLQFRGRAVEDTHEVMEVEEALAEMLTEGEDLDGHDIAPSAREIRIATDDAEATFARIRPFLARAQLLDDTIAAARALPGERYWVLWPDDHRLAFAPA